MKKLFIDSNGELKLSYLLALALVFIVGGGLFFIPEFKTIFTERFLYSGLIAILSVVLGSLIWVLSTKHYKENGGLGALNGYFVGFLIMVAGIFWPAVELKTDRVFSIPDNTVYYFNGKVANSTDASKKNYYFKEFSLDPKDSVYVVTYGEEPGINKNNFYFRTAPDSLKSKAPRANEDWVRPKSKNAQRLKGKY